MPVTFSGTPLDQIISGIKERIESPDMILELGKSLSEHLVEAFSQSGLHSQSGATVKALSKIGAPEKTSGGWRIGVGDGDAVGNEMDAAPKDTLRNFYDSMKSGYGGVYQSTNIKPTAWAGIPEFYKLMLEAARRGGNYGGRGPDYANYMWVQDKGNARAHVTARGFIDSGLNAWRDGVDGIVGKYLHA